MPMMCERSNRFLSEDLTAKETEIPFFIRYLYLYVSIYLSRKKTIPFMQLLSQMSV